MEMVVPHLLPDVPGVAAGTGGFAGSGGALSALGAILLVAAGTVFYGLLTWPLAHKVVEEAGALRIARRHVEAPVPFEDIVAVRLSLTSRPRRVVLQFDRATQLGRDIAFLPKLGPDARTPRGAGRHVWQRAEAARPARRADLAVSRSA